jgi:hypothetical protein
MKKPSLELLEQLQARRAAREIIRQRGRFNFWPAFIGQRMAPELWRANRELEDALVDYFVRIGGNVSGAFVEIIWMHVKERGHEVCSTCHQTMRWHAIESLRLVTDEGLDLSYVRE